jgi:hypothetical protein
MATLTVATLSLRGVSPGACRLVSMAAAWSAGELVDGGLGDGGEEVDEVAVGIDGTLIPVDRVAAARPFYSGKHRRHGMNLQVISAPDGEILWVSGPLPGAVHDLTAARIWGIIRELAAVGLVVLADKGYHGAGDPVLTPYRGRNKPASQKDANRAHAQLQSPGERANAQLKTWQHPVQTPLLPLARRAAGQGHPRPSSPRDRRMKRLGLRHPGTGRAPGNPR